MAEKIKKLPGEDGIEIKHSQCAICSPGLHCGLSCYVKDGKVIKVEGWDEHPFSKGGLCTKGLSNREFLYRKDRVLYPMKRVGERGEGKFERISWEQAYTEIAEKMNAVKDKYGADKVAFYSGYNKWYRNMLARFAHSFGSQSYGTESSSCFVAGEMAWQCRTGTGMTQNLETDLLIGWANNGFYSKYTMMGPLEKAKARGMKYIVVDPRVTPGSIRYADLHLRPHLGTDGALALTIANCLIKDDAVDHDYIEKYVHGYEEYKAYVAYFTPEKGEELTGVPARDILKAVEMIKEAKTMSITECSAPIPHHRNGLQNYRAQMSLLAITGNIDVPGGQKPAHFSFSERNAGFTTLEEEFMYETFPQDADKAVGSDIHPLWYYLRHDMQANDLPANVLKNDEKSIKALYAHGLNFRMFTDNKKWLEVFKKLDLYVDVDLFMTDSAKWADYVLPCCTSMERYELKAYPGQLLWYVRPVVEPLGESKRDVDIISELANYIGVDDEILCSGYENACKYMFRETDVDLDEVMATDGFVKVKAEPYKVGTRLEKGWPTPTGKIELVSEVIAQHPEWGLNALPTYVEPYTADSEKYPFRLCAGTRIPNAIHSRLHDSPWERSLTPEPQAEMNPADCDRLGVELGDDVLVETEIGGFTYKVVPTLTVKEGEVYIYHGYREKDINSILPYDKNNWDPYSGYPAYRSAYCNVKGVKTNG